MRFDEDDIKEAAQNLAIVAHLYGDEQNKREGLIDEVKRTIMASFGSDPMGQALISFTNLNSTIPNASEEITNIMSAYEQKFTDVYLSDYQDVKLMRRLYIYILGFWNIGIKQEAKYNSTVRELIELGGISINRQFFSDVYNLLHEGAIEKKKELEAKKKRGSSANPFEQKKASTPAITDGDEEGDEGEDNS
jgi:hypothetical protein